MTTLVRPDQPADDLDRLRTRIAELEAVLVERSADADRINRELDMFAAYYRQLVGTLHEQLDQIELDIAEAELGELSKKVAEGRRPRRHGSVAGRRPSPRRASPPTPCASCFATSPGPSTPTSPATSTRVIGVTPS